MWCMSQTNLFLEGRSLIAHIPCYEIYFKSIYIFRMWTCFQQYVQDCTEVMQTSTFTSLWMSRCLLVNFLRDWQWHTVYVWMCLSLLHCYASNSRRESWAWVTLLANPWLWFVCSALLLKHLLKLPPEVSQAVHN